MIEPLCPQATDARDSSSRPYKTACGKNCGGHALAPLKEQMPPERSPSSRLPPHRQANLSTCRPYSAHLQEQAIPRFSQRHAVSNDIISFDSHQGDYRPHPDFMSHAPSKAKMQQASMLARRSLSGATPFWCVGRNPSL